MTKSFWNHNDDKWQSLDWNFSLNRGNGYSDLRYRELRLANRKNLHPELKYLVSEFLTDQLLAQPPQLLRLHAACRPWQDRLCKRIANMTIQRICSIIGCQILLCQSPLNQVWTFDLPVRSGSNAAYIYVATPLSIDLTDSQLSSGLMPSIFPSWRSISAD